MARMTKFDIINNYQERTSVCSHVNESDVWGIGFETVRGRLFVYSNPCGGLYCQDWNNDIHQLEGTCQFSGATSRSIKKYMDRAY